MIPSSSWTTPTSDSHEEMTAVLKKELRRRITSATQTLSDAEVTAQSFLLAEKVCALPEFVRARGVSVYLEMPKEAATSKLLEAAFASDKKVFVPKIFGRSADDLMMLQTMAMEDVRSFPKVSSYCSRRLAVCRLCGNLIGRNECWNSCRTSGTFQIHLY